MAKMELTTQGEGFEKLKTLGKIFPMLNKSLLGFVGKEVKNLLIHNYLQGQKLNFNPALISKNKGSTVYFAYKKTEIVLTAYPLNLFEHGRKLRSGKIEPGKKILTRQLKQLVNQNIVSITDAFEQKILKKEISNRL